MDGTYISDIACSTRTTCVGVGSTTVTDSKGNQSSPGAVISITNGVPGSPTVVGADSGPGFLSLFRVACATASLCVAAGDTYTTVDGKYTEVGVLVSVSDGSPGQPITGGPVLTSMACPSADECIAVGITSSATNGYGYSLNPQTLSLRSLGITPYPGALGCTSPLPTGRPVCLMGGETGGSSSVSDDSISAFYGDSFLGTVQAPVSSRRFEGPGIRGISCPSTDLCEASDGGDGALGGYFGISIGATNVKGTEKIAVKVGPQEPVSGTSTTSTIACGGEQVGCVLGGWSGSGSSATGELVTLDPMTGELGSAMSIPGLAAVWGSSLPDPITVTSTKDAGGASSPDSCGSNSGDCTLRAALQDINSGGKGDAIFWGYGASYPSTVVDSVAMVTSSVSFAIPSSAAPPVIKLSSPLPTLTMPVTIDGTTQPNTPAGQPGVQIDGSAAGSDANGLELDGKGSSVNGLIVTGFKGDGLLLKGDNSTVTNSWIGVEPGSAGGYQAAPNANGIEVASSNDVLGGTASGDRDVISGNGRPAGLHSFLKSLKGQHDTAAHLANAALGYGAGILIQKSDVSNLSVEGDYIGLAPDGTDLAAGKGNATGIAIASSGSVSNIAIGANPGGNVITGNVVGVLAAAPPYNALSGVKIEGNLVGDLPKGEPTTNDIGNEIGVLSAGNVAGLVVGAPGGGLGNTFDGDTIGLMIVGAKKPVIQSNAFGADGSVDKVSQNSSSLTLGKHDLLGAMLLDTTTATFGGGGTGGGQVASSTCGLPNDSCTKPGDETASALEGSVAKVVGGQSSGSNAYAGNDGVGNSILGVPVGLLIAGDGKGSSHGNVIEGNLIGRQHDLAKTAKQEADAGFPDAGAILGLTLAGSSNDTVANNSVLGTVGGIFTTDSPSSIFQWNVLSSDGVGLLALGGNAGDHIGGTSGTANDGNIFVRDGIGLVLGDYYPSTQAVTAAALPSKDIQPSQFETPLESPVMQDDLDAAGAVANEAVGAGMVNPKPAPGSGYVIDDNGFGTDGSGTKNLGNLVGAMVVGNVTHGEFAGNVVADNEQGGLWVIAPENHNNSLAVYGDSFYDNTGGSSSAKNRLGLDLWTLNLSGHELGPDQPSAKQPGTGANRLQNYPVLTKVQANSNGGITITGTLDSAPRTTYRVDLYSNTTCNPAGYGEGALLLGTTSVATAASGTGHFSATIAPPSSNVGSPRLRPHDIIVRGKFVSATATGMLPSQKQRSAASRHPY